MKVKVKHWHDWLDGFEITPEDNADFDVIGIGKEIDISQELLDEYKKAEDNYIAVCRKIKELMKGHTNDR